MSTRFTLFEDAIEEAFERKTLKYPELVVASTHTRQVEIGVRGFTERVV